MREITFKRDKKFNALLVRVFIFLDDKETSIASIKNGQTLVYAIDDQAHKIYVAWQISTGPKGSFRTSEVFEVSQSNEPQTILIRNKYTVKDGSIFYLQESQ